MIAKVLISRQPKECRSNALFHTLLIEMPDLSKLH